MEKDSLTAVKDALNPDEKVDKNLGKKKDIQSQLDKIKKKTEETKAFIAKKKLDDAAIAETLREFDSLVARKKELEALTTKTNDNLEELKKVGDDIALVENVKALENLDQEKNSLVRKLSTL